MKQIAHLELQAVALRAAQEWNPALTGWLFVHIQDGEGYLLNGHKPQLLGPGDTLALGAGPHWQVRASQLGVLHFQFFNLCPDKLGGLLSVAEEQLLQQAAHNTQSRPRHFAAPSPVAQQFRQGCLAAGRSLESRLQLLRLAITALSEELAVKPAAAATVAVTAQERLDQLLSRLSPDALADSSLSDLARQCGCSSRHFARLFKARFGHSLQPKKTEIRLRKARQLLEETNDKIINVALESGYQHVGLFCSVFKKRFGVTPSRWRKKQNQATARKRHRPIA